MFSLWSYLFYSCHRVQRESKSSEPEIDLSTDEGIIQHLITSRFKNDCKHALSIDKYSFSADGICNLAHEYKRTGRVESRAGKYTVGRAKYMDTGESFRYVLITWGASLSNVGGAKRCYSVFSDRINEIESFGSPDEYGPSVNSFFSEGRLVDDCNVIYKYGTSDSSNNLSSDVTTQPSDNLTNSILKNIGTSSGYIWETLEIEAEIYGTLAFDDNKFRSSVYKINRVSGRLSKIIDNDGSWQVIDKYNIKDESSTNETTPSWHFSNDYSTVTNSKGAIFSRVKIKEQSGRNEKIDIPNFNNEEKLSSDTSNEISAYQFQPGYYMVNGSENLKIYFHNAPDPSTKRKAYFSSQEKIYIQKIENGYGYVEFTNDNGQTSHGWIEMQNLIVQLN